MEAATSSETSATKPTSKGAKASKLVQLYQGVLFTNECTNVQSLVNNKL